MKTPFNTLLIILALTLISGCENMMAKDAPAESEQTSQAEKSTAE
ncbi:MAG: hypothetical protein OEY11_10770 [Gammaproteobacteria bacterium]|nr:hypothetical protein [Gammaproteobacteria bacterium]